MLRINGDSRLGNSDARRGILRLIRMVDQLSSAMPIMRNGFQWLIDS